MAMTPEAFARMQKALLPPSKLWRLLSTGIISRVFLAAGDELARVDARGEDLIRESDPRTATELLPDFEEVLGLPSDGTLAERRARVVAQFLLLRRRRPIDYQEILGPLLGLDPEDVVVIETSRSEALAMNDDRAIYQFYIYRNPGLPGVYDIQEVQEFVDRMADSHTRGYVIESINFLCDDPESLCDRDILGV